MTDSDKRLELAYEAAQTKLSLQDGTLSNTRTRASGLLATTALFVSFSAGVGLIGDGSNEGVAAISPYVAGVMLVLVVALGACVVVVLLPAKGWCYVPSAEIILEKTDAGWSESEIRRHVISAMIAGAQSNSKMLVARQKAFRAAVWLLILEVVVLVATLIP